MPPPPPGGRLKPAEQNALPPAGLPRGGPRGRPAAAALSTGALIVYALPAGLVGMMYTILVVAYAKYTTDVLLVSGLAGGLIMGAAKIWDAFSDPMAGFLSDRTRARLGRRKSWILASAVPLGVFFAMLWAPPLALDGAAKLLWLATGIFGFYTLYTAFEVPHAALGAELSFDSNTRNRLFGARQLAKTAIGLMLASYLGGRILESDGSERAAALEISAVMGALVIASIALAVWRLPAEPAEHVGRGARSPLQAVRDVWGNRHARLLLLVLFVEAFGMGGIGVLVPYVVEYVMLRPDLMVEMLAVYVVAGIAGIPVWVILARRVEKRRLWMFAMGQACVGFGSLAFLGPDAWPLMVFSSVVAGSAQSCGNVLGMALKAEVIDWDEHRTGERKEGSYFAAWAFVSKLAQGLMYGLVLIVLDSVGYVPNAAQSPTVRGWMIFLMGGLPVVGYVTGMLVFRRFDFSEADHRRIRAEIDAR